MVPHVAAPCPTQEPEPEPEPPAPVEEVKPSLPPLKMELVVRLVPLYMVQDTQAAGSDIPEAGRDLRSNGRRGAAATWSIRFSCL